MKKFNIRKVLDGLKEASSSTSAPSVQVGPQENHLIQETIQSEHFQLCKTVRHGFPYQPSSMAFDPVQKILAIGTQSGALRLFGRPGVESYCQHESGAAVIQLQFLINERAPPLRRCITWGTRRKTWRRGEEAMKDGGVLRQIYQEREAFLTIGTGPNTIGKGRVTWAEIS
ncbi:hypothetical protein fugu_017441 [Takifugu bimaculatus]|uniref:Lethal giant larvae homologue 2 domain-containing protein n=1 Tax=Takifugu bimaculatus TaxID=433685 RepID=A0A4Z2BRY8_9TELE|nr:hypothetical protein fugu_017441 [Takifugu bimaculatus]